MEIEDGRYTDCFAYTCNNVCTYCEALTTWYDAENKACGKCPFYKKRSGKTATVAEARRQLRKYIKQRGILKKIEALPQSLKEKKLDTISEIKNNMDFIEMVMDAMPPGLSKELLIKRIKLNKTWEECARELSKSESYLKHRVINNAVNIFAETLKEAL